MEPKGKECLPLWEVEALKVARILEVSEFSKVQPMIIAFLINSIMLYFMGKGLVCTYSKKVLNLQKLS